MFLIPNLQSARRSNAAADVCSPAATLKTPRVKAISEGYRDYVRLAIYAESQNYCMPCGSCRQFLSEFNDGELEILCCKADGRYVSYRLKELLPYTFNY